MNTGLDPFNNDSSLETELYVYQPKGVGYYGIQHHEPETPSDTNKIVIEEKTERWHQDPQMTPDQSSLITLHTGITN